MRKTATDIYYSSLMELESIRVTDMTQETFFRFIKAGTQNISVLEQAMKEITEEEKRLGLEPVIPPYIPAIHRLPDMLMRYGFWDEAQTIYDTCAQIECLSEYDFANLKCEAQENRACVEAIIETVSAGEHSQKHIKKTLAGQHSARAMNWALRYYKGLTREKIGSDFAVDACPIQFCNPEQ